MSELPKRDAIELIASLRDRAGWLQPDHWENPATAAMMREAAEQLEILHHAHAALLLDRDQWTAEKEKKGWQPIETAPEGQRVVIFDPKLGGGWTDIAEKRNGKFSWWYEPTHWMPLPDPPTETP